MIIFNVSNFEKQIIANNCDRCTKNDIMTLDWEFNDIAFSPEIFYTFAQQ